MGVRRWSARWVAVAVVTPVVAGMAPMSSAAPVSRAHAGMPMAPVSGLAAAPASLQAAIRHSLGYSQQPELAASDAASGDEFGWSVALSAQGTTALIGAPFRDTGAGAAYVFTLRRNAWSQAAELTTAGASDTPMIRPGMGRNSYIGAKVIRSADVCCGSPPPSGDQFGWSVALSAQGRTALVGAPNGDTGTGAAYVFTLRWGAWSQAGDLTASDAASGDQFGWSVALSAQGSMALAGARGHNSGTGAAYVFTLRWGAWSQAGDLTASDAASGDQFGSSVALSNPGTTALIGAPSRDTGTGAAYVFTLRSAAWSQAGDLTASDAATLDNFGWAVALSAQGSMALIGAPGHNSLAGAAYLLIQGPGA